jgi:hypothetical protein
MDQVLMSKYMKEESSQHEKAGEFFAGAEVRTRQARTRKRVSKSNWTKKMDYETARRHLVDVCLAKESAVSTQER